MLKLLKTIGISLFGILILAVSQNIASTCLLFDLNGFQYLLEGIVYVVVTICLLNLFANKVLNKTLLDMSITSFRVKRSWIILSIVLPLSVIILTIVLVPGTFLSNSYTFYQQFQLIMYGLFTIGLSVGIVEEVIFRGLIMSTVIENYGKFVGIFIPSILFGLLHLLNGGLNLASFFMLLIGGTVAGILFSLLTYFNKTVWASIITHSFWNFFMIGGLIHFGETKDANAIVNYLFTKDNTLLTGGEFGVEVSVISIVCFLVCIFYVCYQQSKKGK